MLVLAESELSTMIAFSESSATPISSQGSGAHYKAPWICQDYPHSPSESASAQQHLQASGVVSTPSSPGGAHQNRQWDINDNTLPLSELYDPFELWPSGHYRRVYPADNDDARRHVSGWAMRNTNNHNALILKKSCLGVLVCSLDCLLESGRKVHLRPAICDKARRKQIGKQCPNSGCSGKLTLLSCRGHCGYPVTHFWRHINNTVYFQAKGYHDHPKPEIKSLTDKSRMSFSKQICRDGNRRASAPIKRRFPVLTTDDIPDKKVFISAQDEVMCSCPPFECMCSKSRARINSFIPSTFDYPRDSDRHSNPFITHRTRLSTVPGMDILPHGSFTQINITNTCLSPTTLDLSIPSNEVFQNRSRYGPRDYYHDRDIKFLSYGNDRAQNHLSNDHLFFKSNQPETLRSQEVLNYFNSTIHQQINSSTASNKLDPRICTNTRAAEDKDSYNKYRISSCRIKSAEHQSRSNDGHETLGLSLKSEQGVFSDMPASFHGEGDHRFQSETSYDHLPLTFMTNQLLPPRSTDCHVKFEHSSDTVTQNLNGQEEPTYITLTSREDHNQSAENHREFHSCRMVSTNRSPNTSALDTVIYPTPPPQVTRVELNTTSPVPNTRLSPQHEDHKELTVSPSTSSRRSPTFVPYQIFNDNSSDTHGNSGRPTSFYLPDSPFIDRNTSPVLLTADSNMLPLHPVSTAAYGGYSSTPYGMYCNDISSSTQQTYRNHSINITLTYN